MSSLATYRVDQCSSDEFSAQPFALSPAQTALWYAQRIRPDVPLNISQWVEIHGDLDAGRLLYAIERFGAETQVGQVRLVEIDGVPYQVVDPVRRPAWVRIDLRSEPDPHAAALRWMHEHTSSPIDLEHDSLTFNAVLRIGDADYIWYSFAHHIVIDAYGAMNALTRTAEIYTALENRTEPSTSRATSLAELYAGEADYHDSHRFHSDREYWFEKLRGVGDPVSLGGVKVTADTHDAGRRLVSEVLPEDYRSALDAVTSACDTTDPAVFVASVAAYIRSVTGNPDVVLSLPVAARTTVSLRRSAGVVSNVVPIRLNFDDAITVCELVKAAELQITGALRHQRYRHEAIRRDSGYSRDARGFFGPMVNIMLFHGELRFGSLVGSMHLLATGPVEDLSVNVYYGAGGNFHVDFEANPRLYGETEITDHHARYLDFLDRFLEADPKDPVESLVAITPAEREHVLCEWNATEVPRQEGTLADLFAERAALDPDAIALEFGNEILTYGELDARANRLARMLIAHGAGPDTTVGLCLRRSLDLVVGMYAIVKSGAAYLPLDTDHPIERIEQIVRDAEPLCVLTAARDGLTLSDAAKRLDIDTERASRFDDAPVTDADRRGRLRPDHLAYVIFTSGSTGKPKGVAVTHAAIVNRLRWMQHSYPLDGTDAVLQKTPVTFDVSVWEFFWPLQVGARLVVAAPDGHRDPLYLARIIAEKQITTVHFVPSMLSVFVAEADLHDCTGLRRVFCSGEALPAATVREFYAALHESDLYNLYGPTEAAVDVTAASCAPERSSVSIGSPIWNTRTYVLDSRLQPAPPGIAGELYLAGIQLARGYLGRPTLSADRFVANPFSPGERMYRTGDLARWQVGRSDCESGVLEYLGRSDFQVKIRGMRIELGEIEAALLDDPAVARAVCVAHRGRTGDELVAYVVAAPPQEDPTPADPAAMAHGAMDTASVLTSLRRRLPEYMVPTSLMELDELPLGSNGKIDRKALPEPVVAETTIRPITEPRTEIERVLAGIFAEVLDTEIGVDDSFFDKGGNSLVGARAVARINAALGTALTIRDLFEDPTIEALTGRFGARSSDASAPRLVPAERPERIPLSQAQQRLWILNRFSEHAAAYNMPLAVQVDGPLDVQALRWGLVDVIARHESLRTTFPDTEQGPYQLIHPAEAIPLALDPIDVDDVDVAALVTEFASYGFDLRNQAPIRVALYRTGPQQHVFLVVLHHICSDGWSIAPLARDLMTAVAARARGDVPQWTALPVQYADFALWQRDLLGEESDEHSPLSRQLNYWRTTLTGLPDQLDLPLDRPRPLHRSTVGARVPFTVPIEIRRAAVEFAASRGVSMFMVLHTILASVLSRLSGSRDIAIGTPIAGRADPALDELVGMFVNTLVLRTDVDPAMGFDGMLDVIRETDLNAFANADVPFERLVDVVNPERSPARHPLFQVMLSYDHAPDLHIELPGVRATEMPISWDVAKFDLQLVVHDDATDGPLSAEFGYATDIFDEITIRSLARRFVTMLAGGVAAPDLPMGDLPILDHAEHEALVPISGAPAEPATTLAMLLTDTAARVPDVIAVRYLGTDTTYRELDHQSNVLARALIDHGAAPEAIVAIALPRGLDAIVAVWAVAKTGAAYVPIDPSYPSERIAHMIGDSGTVLGLTDAAGIATVPTEHSGEDAVEWLVFGSPELSAELAEQSANPITDAQRRHPMRVGNPAYLIYTSGSTGIPKAVVVTHGSIASLAAEQTSLFEVSDSSRTLHFSSPSFDASVLEMLLGFAAGATMVIAPAGMYGGSELATLLRAERVTHAFVTPAALATVPNDGLPELEAVIVGGDACSEELVETWTTGHRMHNMYGPSEATVAATASGPMTAGQPVPLGLPVRGSRLFILDHRLHPVPPGTPGELYLSGSGLARGYLGRFGLTAQRFLANPHGRRGERMYRTGDLVVMQRSGQLRFLGRADDQVKIHGFRIEPREVDNVLRRHPGIRFALTLVHADERGRSRLVSYVTSDRPVDSREIVETARQRLPGYMVPASVMVLDEVPIAPSGKLDRKALPKPVFAAAGASRPPVTELERKVAGVFGTILGHPVTGAEDSFFDLGGNSLLATRLAAAVQAEFGVELPVRTIFETPTIAGIAGQLDNAPQTQRPALAVQTPRPARVPLSLPQQRVWFLNRYAPESGAYNIAFVIHITGALDVPAMRAALADLVGRHEVLRTIFPEDAEGAQQVVLPIERVAPNLVVTDHDESGAHTALEALAHTGFDLTTQTPVRLSLMRTSPERYLLGIVVHHIAADAWSLGPLAKDLATAYVARHDGDSPSWAPLPVQYADFGLWQRACLGADTDPDSVAATQLRYWRTALEDIPDQLPLPYDRPRSATPTQQAGTVRFSVPESVQHDLAAVARDQGVSMFMVVRSAFAVLLRCVTGGRDIVIGTPVAGRSDIKLDDVVGMFVNTVALRSDVDPDRTFTDLLHADRNTELAALAHADVPFERIVEELGSEARASGLHPLFQVALSIQDGPAPPLRLPGLALRAEPLDIALAKFDLELRVENLGLGVGDPRSSFEFVYAADLFDMSTVAALAERFVTVLAAIAADPRVLVREIDARTDHERRTLAPARGVPGAEPCTLATYITDTAQRYPQNTALCSGTTSMTYAEVDRQSNRLARALIARGLGPGDRVALGLIRSIDSVVATLAVAKSGAAFVPIDPKYPADRIRQMLVDSGCALGVTVSAHVDRLHAGAPAGRDLEWLLLDRAAFGAELAAHDDAYIDDRERTRSIQVADLVYLVYTSGSTGTPKGVAVTNRGLSNLAHEIRDRIGIDEHSRTLHFATPSFDAAILDLLMAWGAGAAMVICPTDIYGGDELAALIERERISHGFLTPAALATIDRERWPLPHLRGLLVGGEALAPDLVARWAPDRLMCNVYGPTETTVVITISGALHSSEPITIGSLVRGARALVLDERLRPVPVGVPGELYLSGQGVARGYHDRFGLTASRFVADPYGPAGARMYRTGDVVRWNAAGEVVYLGRSDHQVKLRGFRVELGEITAVLGEHPAVRFAYTEVRRIAGVDRIVAYVQPADGMAGVDVDAVRAAVADRLPVHMVPASITLLDTIPLTPVGKLDTKALPEPQFAVNPTRHEPRTAMERLVAGVMGELVDADDIRAEDSFFDIGGNSLLATQLVARLASATGVRLAVRTVFATPTVAELATLVDTGTQSDQTRPPLRRRERPERVPLSAAQRRLWFLNRFNAGVTDTDRSAGAYNVPLVLRITGRPNVTALARALDAVQARHQTLRTVFPEIDGTPNQVVLDPAEAAISMARTTVRAHDLEATVRRFAAVGFDLSTDVPIRAALITVAAGDPSDCAESTEHVLVVVAHHIAMDGWSLEPLAADVSIAYRAACAGQEPDWPELEIQYADYTLWQHDVLGDEDDPDSAVRGQLDYWRTTLAGIPELLTVPADRPRPPAPSYRGGTVECAVDRVTHRELQMIAGSNNVSVFMVLHAALAVLLHRMTAADDIVVGSPIAGRGDAALDRMVGMFVNTVVLRTSIDPDARFTDLLHTVRETDLDAFAHVDLPFERLVEVLNPARSRAHHPMFQVMLSVRNEPVGGLHLPGLQIEAVDLDTGVAKFDLQFTLTETQTAQRDPAGITVAVNYATDLFDESTAQRLGRRLTRLLAAIAANPTTAVGDLELLDPAEWSELAPVRGAKPDRPVTFPEAFDQAANVDPEAVALVSDGVAMTYDTLDRWTNRIARVLIARGVGPETLVALGIPRSVESVAAVLAVAKAGAAFVPVDPLYPDQRIAHMLSDSGTTLGITLSGHRDQMPQDTDWIVLDDPHVHRLVHDSSDAPILDTDRSAPLRVDNPAYVIYTSGSTGIPKGVMVTHGGLSNFAAETAYRFNVQPGNRVLHFATPSFDAAMLELLLALGGAAQLVITPPGVVGGDELGRVFAEQRITHAFITTSALGTVDPTGITELQHVLVGGEALPPDLVTRWAPGRNLYNVYGPTETTIVTVISHPMTPGEPITIGGPIRGVNAAVLDARLHPTPIGVTGELHLAGDALARGYLNRPGLTAQRFVANPFGKPGERMYRTGDLVRWWNGARGPEHGAHGTQEIEYVGRTDHQVKIRGFRIELGEIDAALAAHGQVAFSTTIGHRAPSGATALVSYVKAHPGVTLTATELTDHLATLVPNYMIPQSIMLLEDVPLSPVGKLDRTRLPEPVFAAAEGYRAPTTPMETALCAAFADVLGMETVGVDDGFFELGGNSLLATKVVAHVREAGIDLPVQLMFGAATPAAIAAHLDGAQADADAAVAAMLQPVLPIRPSTAQSPPPLFCIHPAIGLAWCYSGLLAHLAPDRPVYGLQAPHVAGEPDYTTITEAARNYVAMITTIRPQGPYYLLGWSLGGLIAHEVAVQLQQAGHEVALAMMDSYLLSDELIDQATPRVSEIVAEFGAELGEDIDPDLSVREAAALLRERPGPFAALTVEHLERLYAGYDNGAVLAHSFRPRIFDGDLVFFTAGEDEINRTQPDRNSATWQPFITGAVHDHELRCEHSRMTTPEALAVIGPVLRAWLETREMHR
ncbi:amino acid adenylation domain-containing protein [Nocardia sp. CNY236]|uniref:non-ribosomal peptide synthetase n=1 Tax=Nocardia sp. CNY236 TaxID=1169152 RepID=UPI000417B054|nr:non-ribosomal peptide synthetase [Nocardia sp. CNY236]